MINSVNQVWTTCDLRTECDPQNGLLFTFYFRYKM